MSNTKQQLKTAAEKAGAEFQLAQERVAEARAAVERKRADLALVGSMDVATKVTTQLKRAEAELEQASAVANALSSAKSRADEALRLSELEALVAEQAAAEAAVEPAAQALALVVREVAGRIVKAWAEFDAVRRKADQLASQLQAEGKQPPRRDSHGLAAGVLSSERYRSTPHVTENLDPMLSAAALTAYEQATPAREAEMAEQRRRNEAQAFQASLSSPDASVREAAQAELKEQLARFHGRGAEHDAPPVRLPNGVRVGAGPLSEDATLERIVKTNALNADEE